MNAAFLYDTKKLSDQTRVSTNFQATGFAVYLMPEFSLLVCRESRFHH